MSPFYGNIGIWGENMGQEREISVEIVSSTLNTTACTGLRATGNRNPICETVVRAVSKKGTLSLRKAV